MQVYKFLLFIIILFAVPSFAFAGGNFSVYPNKFDLRLAPGEKIVKEIVIANNSDKKLNFELTAEDFIGSGNPEEKIKFLGNQSGGKFSLKSYIKPEINNFTLNAGEQISFNAEIAMPQDIRTENGLYAALITSAKLADSETAINSISRVATLFLVNVNQGGNQDSAEIKKFGQLRLDIIRINEDKEDRLKPRFKFSADNADGQYHLPLLGNIKIYDWRRKEIEKIDIGIWYVLPGSKAEKIVATSKKLFFGKYEAKAELVWENPISGVEEKQIKILEFWILPWPLISNIIFIIIGVILLIFLWTGWKIARRASVIILALGLGFILIIQPVSAALKSENYKIIKDSISVGGADSGASANYSVKNTAGEVIAGNATSSSYQLRAGFRISDAYGLSISTPDDVAMGGCRQGLSCVSNGTVSWTVTTVNPSGYTLSVSAATSPALKSGSNYFSDYGSGASFWSVDSKASAFGFAVGATGETDIVSAFKDNGTACGAGSNVGSCYRGFDGATSIQVINRSSAAASGNTTTVKLKAEVGSNYGQALGAYTATITATAAAL